MRFWLKLFYLILKKQYLGIATARISIAIAYTTNIL